MDATNELNRQWEDMDPTTAHINAQADKIARLELENRRLRGALEAIAYAPPSGTRHILIDIAERALEAQS